MIEDDNLLTGVEERNVDKGEKNYTLCSSPAIASWELALQGIWGLIDYTTCLLAGLAFWPTLPMIETNRRVMKRRRRRKEILGAWGLRGF